MCGEQTQRVMLPVILPGSPPRVRGTAWVYQFHPEKYRITPACAGNSFFSNAPVTGSRDHPRVCGEQLLLPKRRLPRTGSPPRVRGTVRRRRPWARPIRITPACAGNRNTSALEIANLKDHPRVCGEQIIYCHARDLPRGSPPRVRGTDDHVPGSTP